MNKLNVYLLRDNLVGDSSLILTAKNDAVLKRNVKGVMLSQQQNPLNTDTADKCIYYVGTLDTDEGKIETINNPVYVFGLEEVRLELVDEINRKKEEARAKDLKYPFDDGGDNDGDGEDNK